MLLYDVLLCEQAIKCFTIWIAYSNFKLQVEKFGFRTTLANWVKNNVRLVLVKRSTFVENLYKNFITFVACHWFFKKTNVITFARFNVNSISGI